MLISIPSINYGRLIGENRFKIKMREDKGQMRDERGPEDKFPFHK